MQADGVRDVSRFRVRYRVSDVVPLPTRRRLVLESSGKAAVQGAQREGDGGVLERHCQVCEWLVTACGNSPEPIFTEASSVQVWPLAQGCRRCATFSGSGGIMSEGNLALWFRANGFPSAQVGNHISARAEEHILSEASASDARVVLLESGYVVLALHRGRHMGTTPRLSGPQGNTHGQQSATRKTHTQTVGRVWTSLIWEMSSRRESTRRSLARISSVVASGSVFLLRCVNGIGSWGRCRPKRARGRCVD